jgi:hypothetical protein
MFGLNGRLPAIRLDKRIERRMNRTMDDVVESARRVLPSWCHDIGKHATFETQVLRLFFVVKTLIL